MKEFLYEDVSAALAEIRLYDGAEGIRSDFERAVAFSLPTDPIKKSIEASVEPLLYRQLMPQVAITMVAKRLKKLKEQKGSHLKSVKEALGFNSVIINFPSSNYCWRHSKTN